MATKLKEVDAVIVGLGWTGGILAKELAEAGLKVVALERGAMRIDRQGLCGAQHPRRVALRGAPRPHAEHRARHAHGAQQSLAGSAADAAARLVPARRGRRRLGRALERPHLALDRHGVQGPQPLRGALRQELHPRRHDHPGLGHHLRRARAVLRQVRIHRGGVGQGRQHQGADSARRQSVRGAARARLSAAAAHADPGERDVHQGGGEQRLPSVPAAVGERLAGLYQSRRVEIRRRANIAAIASASAARPTRRAARTSP